MYLTQKEFVKRAGDLAVVWVAPARVTHHAGTKWPVSRKRMKSLNRILPRPMAMALRPIVKSREPLLIPARRFGAPVPVTETERYLRVQDFIEHRNEVEDSAWYRDLIADLNRTGRALHKTIVMRSRADILSFLNGYVGTLVSSLESEGFSPESGGYESVAVIDANGAICKSGSGNHRFNISHALDLPTFPLRIVGVHEDWILRRHERRDVKVETLIEDFAEVAAAHQK